VAPDGGIEGDHGSRVVGRWVLIEALVWPMVVEVMDVLVENATGVSFVVDQHAVGAFGADAADKSFCVTVRPGRARRGLDHGDVFGGEDGVDGIGELAVPVADQKAEGVDLVAQVHQQVAGGLGGPGCGWVSGHSEDVHPAGAHLHHEQDVEPAQGDGVEGKEVGGQQPGGLGPQESPPSGVGSAWCRTDTGWRPESGGSCLHPGGAALLRPWMWGAVVVMLG
jgi:hypothetical protein